MAALRKLLMYCSALTAVIIFAVWIFFSRTFDIMPFGLIVLFLANSFYVYFSRPTVQTSDILEEASSKLGLASFELRYMSEQARLRELEAEKMRLANVEKEKYKLQVAKDMLEHMQLKISPRQSSADDHQPVLRRPRIGDEVIAQVAATSKPEKIGGPGTASSPTTRDRQSIMPNGLTPAAASLN